MTQGNDNFEELRRLLSLKQHEQPPPGYFNRFSDALLERIEDEVMFDRRSWWQRVVSDWDFKPALACAYGLTVVSLVIFGVRFSMWFEAEEATGIASTRQSLAVAHDLVLPVIPASTPHIRTLGSEFQSGGVSSIRPVFSHEPPAYVPEFSSGVRVIPASYSVPARR